MSVIVSEDDAFDYGSGEPSADVRTMLRELKVRSLYF
jgi:hypothetical protein